MSSVLKGSSKRFIPTVAMSMQGEGTRVDPYHISSIPKEQQKLLESPNGWYVFVPPNRVTEFYSLVASMDGKGFGTDIAHPVKVEDTGINLYRIYIER